LVSLKKQITMKIFPTTVAAVLTHFVLLSNHQVNGFSPLFATTAMAAKKQELNGKAAANKPSEELLSNNNRLLVNRVAVVGATGRTGRLVVQELLNRGVGGDQDMEIVAMVRSKSKAKEVFGNSGNMPTNVKFVECDLTNEKSVANALKGMEAAIWCATGFSSESNWIDKAASLLGIATKRSIDSIGLPLVAKALKKEQQQQQGSDDVDKINDLPKLIMCSSAGVTRPTWDEAKQKQFPGAADIPIVRLNPFGILDIKRESEEKIRQNGGIIPYCIVRPCGLNDSWPKGSRPIVSQGDVAVGRINRQDVATLLVDLLSEPDATYKTFEVIGLCNYPKGSKQSMTASLQRFRRDDQGEPPMEIVEATYAMMQQLLPGETQDAAALAMGQTYEQLDKGETGRLGERGTEKAEQTGLGRTS